LVSTVSDPGQLRTILGGKVLYEARFVPGGILIDLGGDCQILWTGGLSDELYTEIRDACSTTVPRALVWTVGLDGGDPTSFLSGFGNVGEFLDRGQIGHLSLAAFFRFCSDAGIEHFLDGFLGPGGERATENTPVPALPEASRGTWLVVLLANLRSLAASTWNSQGEARPGTPENWGMGALPTLEKLLRVVRHPGFHAAAENPSKYFTYYMNGHRYETDPALFLYSDNDEGTVAWGLNYAVQETLFEALRNSCGEDGEREGLIEGVRQKCLDVLYECCRQPAMRQEFDLGFQQAEHGGTMFLPAIARFLGFPETDDLRQDLAKHTIAQALDCGGEPHAGPEPFL
jgi:hypothetical protein